MMIIVLFSVLSLLFLALLLSFTPIHLFPAILASLGFYILLHILCCLFYRIIAAFTPADRPIVRQSKPCRRITPLMSKALNCYAGIVPRITGLEKLPTDTRFLFVCNHRSMFDPLFVMAYLGDYNISFISKPSNMKLPVVGRIVYAIGYLPIDRESNRNALKTILTAADYLKRDLCSIGIYPEGTRSKTCELLPFHAGSFKIAQRAGVPVAVACMHGTEKLRPWRPFRRTEVYLDILELIPAEAVLSMRTEELAEKARSLIQADLDRTDGKIEV